MQTIFAPATPAGRSALAVLRISGPNTTELLKRLAPKFRGPPRKATLARLYAQPDSRHLLDEALVIPFKAPSSYTGEDSCEIYLHGSPVVMRAVQNAIIATKLARVADPGEFTKRAFQNGRLDLAKVEGIRDLLAAETEQQRQTAVLGAVGAYTRQYETWRSDLVHVSGMLAATIDFAEDNGFEEGQEDINRRVRKTVERVRNEMITAVKQSASCAELIKEGLRVALIGAPNAGKSSLTNLLAKRAACLVSDVPGTTRDVLEIALEIGGHKIVLLDTAGIRDSDDKIEQLGIERAKQVAEQADLVIALDPMGTGNTLKKEIDELEASGRSVLRVTSKSDVSSNTNQWKGIKLSSVTGEGLSALTDAISAHCDNRISDGTSIGAGMSTRARALLEQEAIPGLERSFELLDDVVLCNAELQRAVDAIGTITGSTVSAQEVLGVVFSEFCVGK